MAGGLLSAGAAAGVGLGALGGAGGGGGYVLTRVAAMSRFDWVAAE
ncbi:MAG: hypothetical protein HC916_22165 [Coleofasciculaceae cyanobacterium SM2_1_6]|nr:hypothetical protein [Coleofasciculaceae cyanobacterium SM2_1_6]